MKAPPSAAWKLVSRRARGWSKFRSGSSIAEALNVFDTDTLVPVIESVAGDEGQLVRAGRGKTTLRKHVEGESVVWEYYVYLYQETKMLLRKKFCFTGEVTP